MAMNSIQNCPKIVMVGGGSINWSPKLINDLTLTQGLENAQYIILDKNEAYGKKMALLGRKLCRDRGLNCSFEFTNSQNEAFAGADFVIITISTGGLDAMEYDLKIPEQYGIYQTVGDTVGPGGWARSLRNINVFADMAENLEKLAPNAFVLNYTNPMAVLTNVFYKVSSLKTVGLCHSAYENYLALAKIFDIDNEEDIKLTFGGTNHFFWITDIKIGEEDGYELLKHKTSNCCLSDLIPEDRLEEYGFYSGMRVASELYKYLGYLPYIGDRHICEFIPGYVTGDAVRLGRYKLKRTSAGDRRKYVMEGIKRLDDYLSGVEKLPEERSREIAAGIIEAVMKGHTLTDVVNLPNSGQIENLPSGSLVETLGVIDRNGFKPLPAGRLPEPVLNIVHPHVRNQNMLVEAGLEGNLDKAFWALFNDPLCSHLPYSEIKEMGMQLLKVQKHFMPQFAL